MEQERAITTTLRQRSDEADESSNNYASGRPRSIGGTGGRDARGHWRPGACAYTRLGCESGGFVAASGRVSRASGIARAYSRIGICWRGGRGGSAGAHVATGTARDGAGRWWGASPVYSGARGAAG